MPADVAVKVIEFLLKYPVYFEVYSDAKQYSQAGREKYFTNMDLPRDFLEAYVNSINITDDIIAVAKQGKVEKSIFSILKRNITMKLRISFSLIPISIALLPLRAI